MSTLPAVEPEAVSTGVFAFAGSAVRVETNSPAILSAARSTFTEAHSSPARSFDFKLFAVAPPLSRPLLARQDGKFPNHSPWPQPYFRGRDHLVIAIYGGGAMLFDLLGCRAVGVFSEALASDQDYWRRVIFPAAIGVISASIGVVPLHCATLVRNRRGLHISGLSGVGKSTLSVALAQRGFALLSDDWTYFSRNGAGAGAFGLPVPIKLLPAAQRFFPELRRLSPAVSLNGELAFEVDPAEIFSATRVFSCAPRRIVFLDRRPGVQARWLRLSPAQVENQFRPALERIPECLRSARDQQHEIISALARLESWSLVCGGDPHQIAEEIDRFTDSPPATSEFAGAGVASHFEIPDLMCRFSAAPFTADLTCNGVAVRLHTDLPQLFAQASGASVPHPSGRPPTKCTVLKDDAVCALPDSAASADGLSYRTIRGAACLIADHGARHVVAFVSPSRAQRPAFMRELLAFAAAFSRL